MDLLDGFLQDLQNVRPRLYNKLISTLENDVERTFEGSLFLIFATFCKDGPDALRSIQSCSTERVASMLGEGSGLLAGLDAVDVDTCQPSAGVCPELMRAISCLLLCAVLGDVDAAEQSTQIVLKLWAAFAPCEETSLIVVIHLAWAKFYTVVKAAFIDGTPLSADELETLAESMVSVDTRKEGFDLAAVEIEATFGLADFSAVGITQFQKLPVMIWPSLDNGCITQEIAERRWRLPFNLSILSSMTAYRPSSTQEEGHGAEQGLLWQYWTRHLELALPRLATPPAKPFAKDVRSLGFQQLNCLVSSARDAAVRALTATGTADGAAGKLLCNLVGEICREGPHARLARTSLCNLLVDGGRWNARWARQDQALLPAAAKLTALFRSDGEDEARGDEASEGASEVTSEEASKLDAMVLLSMFVQAMSSWCVEEDKPACQLRAWEAIVQGSNISLLAFALETLTRSPNGAEWRRHGAFGSVYVPGSTFNIKWFRPGLGFLFSKDLVRMQRSTSQCEQMTGEFGVHDRAAVVQTRLLDLPEDMLENTLWKMMDAVSGEGATSCIRARLRAQLVCRRFLGHVKEAPLSLYAEEALSDAEVKWLESADARLENLAFFKEDQRGSWWLLDATQERFPNLLSRSAKTLRSMVGLVFEVKPESKRCERASMDLCGLSALKCLSLACDHQMRLWLPARMEHLEINMTRVDTSDFKRVKWVYANRHKVFSYSEGKPMLWGRRVVVAPADVDGKRSFGRPTWAGLLRGLARLDTLMVQGSTSSRQQGDPWGRVDYHAAGFQALEPMGLIDFEREWPTGFALRSLHARCTFVPFDLAVRDVELLQFSRSVVLLTRASSTSDILDTLLRGRARVLRFCARYKKGLWKLFKWEGPGLGDGVAVFSAELAAEARARRFAGRIAVKKICTKVLGDGYTYWCLDIVVVARRTGSDEEPGPFVSASTLSLRRHRWT